MVAKLKDMFSSTPTRNWYLLRGEEYSCNLRFFKERQIHIIKSGKVSKICSALESYVFKELIEGENSHDYDSVIKEIHTNLLNGKYGDGKFIN
jgi:hypothetical protein